MSKISLPNQADTVTLAELNALINDADVARTDSAQTFTGVQTMTSPVFITPVLGTPTSGNLGNCIGAERIQPISASVAANALTISASALSLDFRSTTLGSGTVTNVSDTPANLVISSGSTLGTTNAIKNRLAILALNNAGTIELAVSNISGSVDLTETGLVSTTAEGGAGAADSATVVYSTTARTNVAYRVIGYIESTQATAGTWATAPSTIQGTGGEALSAGTRIMSGVAVASTSGTSIDFTSIPSWVKRITVMFDGVSTNGSSMLQIQLGDSGGVETTGYLSAGTNLDQGISPNVQNSTTGLSCEYGGGASVVLHGFAQIVLLNNSTWVFSASFGRSDSRASLFGGGSKSLTGTLDRVRITTVNGTDTFDAGSINILYE